MRVYEEADLSAEHCLSGETIPQRDDRPASFTTTSSASSSWLFLSERAAIVRIALYNSSDMIPYINTIVHRLSCAISCITLPIFHAFPLIYKCCEKNKINYRN